MLQRSAFHILHVLSRTSCRTNIMYMSKEQGCSCLCNCLGHSTSHLHIVQLGLRPRLSQGVSCLQTALPDGKLEFRHVWQSSNGGRGGWGTRRCSDCNLAGSAWLEGSGTALFVIACGSTPNKHLPFSVCMLIHRTTAHCRYLTRQACLPDDRLSKTNVLTA